MRRGARIGADPELPRMLGSLPSLELLGLLLMRGRLLLVILHPLLALLQRLLEIALLLGQCSLLLGKLLLVHGILKQGPLLALRALPAPAM